MRRLLAVSTILSTIGIGIGGYLIWVHYDHDVLVCGTGGCEAVQTSEYATVSDIPIAIFGTAMYVTLLLLALLRRSLPAFTLPLSAIALAITVAGTAYSGWLTWLELFEIEAICQWCVASAVVTTLLFLLELLIFRQLWQQLSTDDTLDNDEI